MTFYWPIPAPRWVTHRGLWIGWSVNISCLITETSDCIFMEPNAFSQWDPQGIVHKKANYKTWNLTHVVQIIIFTCGDKDSNNTHLQGDPSLIKRTNDTKKLPFILTLKIIQMYLRHRHTHTNLHTLFLSECVRSTGKILYDLPACLSLRESSELSVQ